MEKIMTLTTEQYSEFEKSKSPIKKVKEILNLSKNAQIGLGDTSVQIENAQPKEVYKNHWKGMDIYYIVIEPLDEQRAMAYSIYPKA